MSLSERGGGQQTGIRIPRRDFVPGTMCDERLWGRLLALLPASGVYGHVPLYRAQNRAAMLSLFDQMAQDGPLHLVAFSMGGYLALEYALSHPGKVASLVLIGTAACALSARERLARQATLAWLETHDYQGMSRHRLAQFIHPEQLNVPEVVDVVKAMDQTLGKAALMVQLRETTDRRNLLPDLHAVKCPVLVVGGEQDELVAPARLAEVVAALPHARLHLLPATGHMIPLEQPEKLARLLKAFWADLPADI